MGCSESRKNEEHYNNLSSHQSNLYLETEGLTNKSLVLKKNSYFNNSKQSIIKSRNNNSKQSIIQSRKNTIAENYDSVDLRISKIMEPEM